MEARGGEQGGAPAVLQAAVSWSDTRLFHERCSAIALGFSGDGMESIPGARWYAVDRADPRLYALYKRHYSAKKNAAWC